MVRIADLVIQRLVDAGIKHIFLVTGRGILYLTDAVAKNEYMNGVSTYHEQGASYAAMAYAAITGGMSACLVSTGCAATNAVTAALCAYQDNLPVIFISGQHMLNETTRYTQMPIRTFGSQEADIISVVKPVTKYAVMLAEPRKTIYEIDKAMYIADEGRKGPVWIDIPLDIQNARVNEEDLVLYHHKECDCAIDPEDITYVINGLGEAERPLLFAGGGIRSADGVDELKHFVEKNAIPIVFSSSAVDTYGASHELSIGAVGSLGGSRAGNFAVQNSDYILAIGTRLCSQTVGDFRQFARAARIVAVDIDDNEHKKNGVRIERVINADAKKFLRLLNLNKLSGQHQAWVRKCMHWKEIFAVHNEEFVKEFQLQDKIDLYNFADTLSEKLGDDAVVITDAGFEELIIPSSIRYREGQRCLFPAAQGAMGYAIPAILGAYFAGRGKIVAVVGDGSFMMNVQELQLVTFYRIPVKIFVINNNMYAVIRKRQHDLFRNRTIGNDPTDGLPSPDFKKIADSFGLKYAEINSISELAGCLDKVLAEPEPIICEVHCAEDQKYLHTSFAFNEKKKLVKRPIEDISPFIDRKVFEDEMLVEPVNT